MVNVARQVAKSPAQVALNWLRSQPGVIPILGAREFSQFEDNMRCLEWTLEPQHRALLEEVSRVELGLPMDLLHRPELRNFLHGGLFDRIQP